MFCNACKHKYTPNPKSIAYSEETKKEALRLLASGNTGRGVGKIMKMSKANVYRWAREEEKKSESVWISPSTNLDAFELDEIFWFRDGRKGHANGVNTFIMTMISRTPVKS